MPKIYTSPVSENRQCQKDFSPVWGVTKGTLLLVAALQAFADHRSTLMISGTRRGMRAFVTRSWRDVQLLEIYAHFSNERTEKDDDVFSQKNIQAQIPRKSRESGNGSMRLGFVYTHTNFHHLNDRLPSAKLRLRSTTVFLKKRQQPTKSRLG